MAGSAYNRDRPQIRGGFGSRVLAANICLLLGLAFTAAPTAKAQGAEWWEQLPGFGGVVGERRKAEPKARTERQAESFDDLRPNATPWLSEDMVHAFDRAIERYERLVERGGGWAPIPRGRTIRPGDDDERIPLVKRRLRVTGELPPREEYFETLALDDFVERAVRKFQRNHGLRVTGRVDRATIDAMNVSASDRLAQLRLNRQRVIELMQPRVDNRYVLVNVPSFEAEAVENYEVQQRHRVIVGREGRETPNLRGTIRALNFFPYWRVPTSVATLDLIPRLRKEPDYLDKEGIRVYDGSYDGHEVPLTSIDWSTVDQTRIRFKQDPGDRNALGLVRLDMSNEHGVYMHDTPMKNLFDQRGRAFSAGCVRVQGVFDLAEWIARGEPGWEQPGRVRDVLDSGQALDVPLSRPVPVIFAYFTAWAEPNGDIQFRPDIYGRDGTSSVRVAGEADPDAPPPPPNGIAP
ncbi:MAG: murein L,D-transpeptidase [Hyphomicrobiaceae bacterium]